MASPRILGKNARLYLADLAFYLKMFEMQFPMEFNFDDSTPYGVNWREQELIDGQASMIVNAFADTEKPLVLGNYVSDQAYWDSFYSGSDFKADPTVPITFIPKGTVLDGDPAFIFKSHLGSLAMGFPRNAIGRLRGRFVETGRVTRGKILTVIEISVAPGDTFFPVAGIDMGVAALKGTVASYHLFKKSGGGSFTIVIQDATASGGPYTAITGLSFPATTVTNSGILETATNGRQFHRLRVNNGGGANETIGIIAVSRNLAS